MKAAWARIAAPMSGLSASPAACRADVGGVGVVGLAQVEELDPVGEK
jgi:hypothetical protein